MYIQKAGNEKPFKENRTTNREQTRHAKKSFSQKRVAVLTLAFALTLTSGLSWPAKTAQAKENGDTELHNPVVVMNECDTVYFGSYWQEDTNGDGVADQKDEKTPIRWRILSRNGDDAYVIADQVLEKKSYNKENADVT